jgi:hypothetical protein
MMFDDIRYSNMMVWPFYLHDEYHVFGDGSTPVGVTKIKIWTVLGSCRF